MEFTKIAGNLLISNEKQFVENYIISECEILVNKLEGFYEDSNHEFFDENENAPEKKYNVDYKGYELIEFRTEKIIGALDFINRIIEYNSILPTKEYVNRIIALCKKLIPNVKKSGREQRDKHKEALKILDKFKIDHNKLVKKKLFYEWKMKILKDDFDIKYGEEYKEFSAQFNVSKEELKRHNHRVILHFTNMMKMIEYVKKYKEMLKNQ